MESSEDNFTNNLKMGEIEFSNGDFYKGQLNQDNQPHGQGVFIYENRDLYIGSVKNGERDGYGTLIIRGVYNYEGEFKDDKPHGQGSFIYMNGGVYTGSVEGGERIGWGELKVKNEYVYFGEFKNNEPNGGGEINYIDGSTYTGQVRNTIPNGFGALVIKDKFTCEGIFKDGNLNGQVKFTLKNGDIYNGVFYNNKAYNPPFDIKDQKVLVINRDRDLLDVHSLKAKYKQVALLEESTSINQKILKSLVTKSTKNDKKKIKIIITEHASKKGKLANQDYILDTLNKILEKAKEYNNKFLKKPIQNIDITLQSCFGSNVVYENKAFQDIMKKIIDAKMDVRISAGDENSTSLPHLTNGKNVIPNPTEEDYTIKIFYLNAETDFNTIEPIKIKRYKSIDDFMHDRYEGKEEESVHKKTKSKETQKNQNVTRNKENDKSLVNNPLAFTTPGNHHLSKNNEPTSKRPASPVIEKTSNGKKTNPKNPSL